MSTNSYAERQAIVMLDGTPTFQNEADRERENEVAKEVMKAWSTEKKGELKMFHFAPLSPIDWYAVRYDRVVGLAELKSALGVPVNKFTYCWLNVRKWLALSLGSVGMGTPALFFVKFEDGIRWIPLNRIDATNHRIGGCRKIVKSNGDIEPVIEVPIASMREL